MKESDVRLDKRMRLQFIDLFIKENDVDECAEVLDDMTKGKK